MLHIPITWRRITSKKKYLQRWDHRMTGMRIHSFMSWHTDGGIRVIFFFLVQHHHTAAKQNGAVVRSGSRVSRRWWRSAQKLCPFAFARLESIPEESPSPDPCCSLGNVCRAGLPAVVPHQGAGSAEDAFPPFYLFRPFGFREVVATAFLRCLPKLEEEARLGPVFSASRSEQPRPGLVSVVWKLHCTTQKSVVIYTSMVAFLAITFHCSFSLNL